MVALRKEWRILIDLLALDKDISRQNEKGYYEDKEKRLIRLKVSFPTRDIIKGRHVLTCNRLVEKH